ncbi:MAG: adenylate/guanylate cyclase domain-containing protein [Actinomycetota bacterium]
MTRTFSAGELAREAGVPLETIDWLNGIGILKSRQPEAFRFADVFRVKMVAALLEGGFTSEQVEWAVAEGHLNLDRVDEYLPLEPGPRSEQTFAGYMSRAGPKAALLPAVYVAMGLPEPDPSSRIHADEEERLRRFLEGWSLAPSDETLIRAARLIAEGTRVATMGWGELLDEQVVRPAQERLYRGEIERFPEEVRRAFRTLVRLQPLMMKWLMERYLEQRIVGSIAEGFEEFFASRNLGPPPGPTAPPAVVFVDLSGYTRLTEERGDEVAVRFATTLQREADAVASANGGRLVKLLGDGAMLRFPDAGRGLEAALALVRALSVDGSLQAHAGVHAGPVIERDLDLFGRTVNLASRIADAAGPGEVLVSEAVAGAVDDPALRFERSDGARLKSITEPVSLFRVIVDRS